MTPAPHPQPERYIRIKKCFDCPNCIHNPEPPRQFQIWRCYTGKGKEFPLDAPNCDNSIPDNCPLPIYESEREKVLEKVRERLCSYGDRALFNGRHIRGVLDDIDAELRQQTKEREQR